MFRLKYEKTKLRKKNLLRVAHEQEENISVLKNIINSVHPKELAKMTDTLHAIKNLLGLHEMNEDDILLEIHELVMEKKSQEEQIEKYAKTIESQGKMIAQNRIEIELHKGRVQELEINIQNNWDDIQSNQIELIMNEETIVLELEKNISELQIANQQLLKQNQSLLKQIKELHNTNRVQKRKTHPNDEQCIPEDHYKVALIIIFSFC